MDDDARQDEISDKVRRSRERFDSLYGVAPVRILFGMAARQLLLAEGDSSGIGQARLRLAERIEAHADERLRHL